jgi:hypothetical protein
VANAIAAEGELSDPMRKKLGIEWNTGDRIKVVDYGGVVSLVPVLQNPEEEGFGALSMRGRSLLNGLKQTRNEERRREKPAGNADAFSVALAKRTRGRVMTGDPEFKAVEPEIAIRWLPDRRR